MLANSIRNVEKKVSNGCHDRPPFKPFTKVADGHWDYGVQRIPKLTSVPFRMAKDCQYTHTALGQADQRCTGCQWKK